MKQPEIASVKHPGFWIIYWKDGTTSTWSASSWTFEAIATIQGVVDIIYSPDAPSSELAVSG